MEITDEIRAYATQTLGFDACGFTAAHHAGNAAHMARWLDAGYGADMDYLRRHQPLKADPESLLPGARSAIVLSKSYKSTRSRALEGPFKIARYAVGQDYHGVIRGRLRAFEEWLGERVPGIGVYSGVDSRPINERGLALAAGLGFRGRNTMVIRPGAGSYFFLAVILTDHALQPDAPIRTNCGTCRACVDACPTDAILEQGDLDARKCISYLNIELKTPLEAERVGELNGWIFGCDICQEVCPFNRDDVPLSDWTAFQPEAGVGFDIFSNAEDDGEAPRIPKDTALYRSRKRVIPNWDTMRRSTPQNDE